MKSKNFFKNKFSKKETLIKNNNVKKNFEKIIIEDEPLGQLFTLREEKIQIKVKNLNLYYHNKHTLKNISLDIPKKKVVAIIGKSGGGKSSFLRCFNRMNDLDIGCTFSGQIYLDKIDINKPSLNTSNLRARVGMVFQKANPFFMSIYNNVAYGPKIHGVKKKKELDFIVKTSLEQAALYSEVKDRLQTSATNLSGGQQQRVCIARALALKPEVILFDEPTSSLDPIATVEIEKLILELKKKYTIIIITHSLRQALRISDYTIFLENGIVYEYNLSKKILSRPKHKLTRKYIDSSL